jgi:hypothetical protein
MGFARSLQVIQGSTSSLRNRLITVSGIITDVLELVLPPSHWSFSFKLPLRFKLGYGRFLPDPYEFEIQVKVIPDYGQ